MANRSPHRIDLEAFDELGREVPVLVDLKPSGDHYMEHFHHAGGVPRLMQELADIMDFDAPSVAGTLRDHVKVAEDVPGQTVIRTRKNPSTKTRRITGCRSISISAASSMRSCICSMPASSPVRCTSWD